MKNFALALQSALRAPHIRQTIFGEEHIRTADSYHLLGWTQYELSCLNSAMQSVWRALYIRRRLLGGEHPDIADSQRLFRLTGCTTRIYQCSNSPWGVCVCRRKLKSSRPQVSFAVCRACFNPVAN